jgi:hypothetical protein
VTWIGFDAACTPSEDKRWIESCSELKCSQLVAGGGGALVVEPCWEDVARTEKRVTAPQ